MYTIPKGIRSVEVQMDDGRTLKGFVTRKEQTFHEMDRVGSEKGTLAFRAENGTLVVKVNAARLPAEVVAAVHEGLRILAGMCDHAKDRDGSGFCKDTAEMGHSLARAPQLTTAQVLAGAALVHRFRRQLPEAIVEKSDALLIQRTGTATGRWSAGHGPAAEPQKDAA